MRIVIVQRQRQQRAETGSDELQTEIAIRDPNSNIEAKTPDPAHNDEGHKEEGGKRSTTNNFLGPAVRR
jgi:hypothetical protein